MWAGIIGFAGILMVIIILAVAVIPKLSGRKVGMLAMIPGAVIFLLFSTAGRASCGVKGYLEIVIAGAILFGCGAIAAAVGQDGK